MKEKKNLLSVTKFISFFYDSTELRINKTLCVRMSVSSHFRSASHLRCLVILSPNFPTNVAQVLTTLIPSLSCLITTLSFHFFFSNTINIGSLASTIGLGVV